MSTEPQLPDDEELPVENREDWRAYKKIEANRDLFERLAEADLKVSPRYEKALTFADQFEEEHDV